MNTYRTRRPTALRNWKRRVAGLLLIGVVMAQAGFAWIGNPKDCAAGSAASKH